MGCDTLPHTPSAMPSEFALVFASDEPYAQGLAVAICSALANLTPAIEPEICVLDNGLSESSRARLPRVVAAARRSKEVHLIRIPAERLRDLPSGRPPSVYSRLLIPELVPPHVQRAVYLDADVLVRRDLSPLFTIELGG